MANEKCDVYQMVTNQIIEQLEKGEIPWAKPWNGINLFGAISRSTKKPYSLLNQFILGKDGEWLTFNQIKEAGGTIKKGEKAKFVVFWKMLAVTKENENGEKIVKQVPVLRYYNVWHIDQTEGVTPKIKVLEPQEIVNSSAAAEEIIKAYFDRESCFFNCDKKGEAYYDPKADGVFVPNISQFNSTDGYYGTIFHEMTHSTGAKCRLNRDGIVEHIRFGSETYSKEELIAELGSAFLVNYVGLSTNNAILNNAAYIQSWLKALKNDKRLIVSAAGKAEKAVKYILGEKD